MGRKRFISSEMSTDEDIADIATENSIAALMWPWFITAFDDWGRMEITSPTKIKLELFPAFPFTAEEIQAAIDQYIKVGIAFKYTIDRRNYMAVEPCKFYKYQTYIREKKRVEDGSNFPAPAHPPWEHCEKCGDTPKVRKPAFSTPSMVELTEEERIIGKIFTFYQENIGGISGFQSEIINQYIDDDGMEPEMILQVLKDGIGKSNPWSWIKVVLANSAKENILTLSQYQAKKVEKENAKKQGSSEAGQKQSPRPSRVDVMQQAFQELKDEEGGGKSI